MPSLEDIAHDSLGQESTARANLTFIEIGGPQIAKARTRAVLEDVLDELSMLREELLNTLETQLFSKNPGANDDAVSTYRIQIPNPSMNLNPALKKSRGQNRAKPSDR